MIKKSIMLRFLSLGLAIAGFVLIAGSTAQVNAQTDPFAKPSWAKPRTASTGSPSSPGSATAGKPKPAGPPPIVALVAPGIEQRINFYKQQREAAAKHPAARDRAATLDFCRLSNVVFPDAAVSRLTVAAIR